MKKATRLASHFATMDFMIERAGNGVIPRELFAPENLIAGEASRGDDVDEKTL